MAERRRHLFGEIEVHRHPALSVPSPDRTRRSSGSVGDQLDLLSDPANDETDWHDWFVSLPTGGPPGEDLPALRARLGLEAD